MGPGGVAVTASAGHAGPDVRSDCRVTLTLDGQSRFQLTSSVEAMYARRIRQTASETLASQNIPDASIEIEDSGALDFTLIARIEAAAHRATGTSCVTGILPVIRPPTQLATTRLYLPGDTPKFYPNAELYQADAVILDLEDSVPLQDKDQALLLVRRALMHLDFGFSKRWVRLNASRANEEIAVLRGLADGFLLPKADTPERVAEVAAACAPASLVPLVETTLGVMRAYEIARCAPNVTGLAFGLEDYCRDLGVERTEDGEESSWALGAMVNAARAAGLGVSASVYSRVDDDEGLERYARRMKALGFEGIGCIHPKQVPIVQRVFAPSPTELARAQRIVEAYDMAGGAVVAVDGAMVDLPVYERAKQVLLRGGRR